MRRRERGFDLVLDPADRDLTALAVIAQHGDARPLPISGGDGFGGKPVLCLPLELFIDRVRDSEIDRSGLGQGAAELGLEVGREQAVCVQNAGRRRDQYPSDAQQFGQRAAMQRAGAAEARQCINIKWYRRLDADCCSQTAVLGATALPGIAAKLFISIANVSAATQLATTGQSPCIDGSVPRPCKSKRPRCGASWTDMPRAQQEEYQTSRSTLST